ncbi:putative transmembrane sodium-solute transporter [Trichinella spiralis]|uniref:putative transmembrane sodium-solute transporter n=1 Tax=Trichinella spiralis TaxID=6334 RepID=UPI0001EFC7F1|nr:putative transmembrane sodium-solute transporter [Trichinella spiralis]
MACALFSSIGNGNSAQETLNHNTCNSRWLTKYDQNQLTTTSDNQFDFLIHNERFFCGRLRIKTAVVVTSIVDAIFWSAVVVRGILFYANVTNNALTASWLTFTVPVCWVSYASSAIATYAICRRHYLLLLPQLVVKIATTLMCTVFAFFIIYLAFVHPQQCMDVTTPFHTEVDTLWLKKAIRIGASIFLAIMLLFVCMEVWFIRILLKSYKQCRLYYFMSTLVAQQLLYKTKPLKAKSLKTF